MAQDCAYTQTVRKMLTKDLYVYKTDLQRLVKAAVTNYLINGCNVFI